MVLFYFHITLPDGNMVEYSCRASNKMHAYGKAHDAYPNAIKVEKYDKED